MNRVAVLCVFFNLLFLTTLQSQKKWTLQECFDYAMQNNISIKQTELNKTTAQNNFTQSKMDLYLPQINAHIGESFNFGSSIDPTTYQYVKQATNATSFGASLNYTLFQGLSRLYNIKASKSNVEANQLEIEEVKNNTRLTIVNFYLQILIAKEALQIAKESYQLNAIQKENIQKLINAGVRTQNDLLDISAQLAQSEYNIVNAKGNLEKAKNQLKKILQIDLFEAFDIAEINLSKEPIDLPNAQAISLQAEEKLPQLQLAQNRLKAAQYQLKSTKGNLLPTLSIGANISTNYFSAAQEASNKINLVETQSIVNLNGTDVPIVFKNYQPEMVKKAFGKQLKDNLTQSISLNLNIPILGAWQRRTAIANAKVSLLQSQLNIENQRQILSEKVISAYTDFNIAKQKYQAAQKSQTATNEALRYAQQKLKAGSINTTNYENIKNRKLNADISTIQAKMEYLMQKIILNYYQTGQFTL